MGKVIRLTESDLVKLIKKILTEDDEKTGISSKLKSMGFTYDKYSGEWRYDKVKDFEVTVQPINGKFEVVIVLDEPSRSISFNDWEKKGKNPTEHPIYVMGKIINRPPYISQGGSSVIEKTQITKSQLNDVFLKMQELIRLIS